MNQVTAAAEVTTAATEDIVTAAAAEAADADNIVNKKYNIYTFKLYKHMV